ncbi:hypothetical protein BDY21DRAFT_61484 [Lineolata rhizophorae]|uniref:Uncharacterized protein n=1 Tax=Lineolata rhizophorae TaxID=578093 RepID=A0A6A6NWH6_9PEZI|nr:hypothetical protein BDY21DRAFT_61484 [Lineolata rhizophorae]
MIRTFSALLAVSFAVHISQDARHVAFLPLWPRRSLNRKPNTFPSLLEQVSPCGISLRVPNIARKAISPLASIPFCSFLSPVFRTRSCRLCTHAPSAPCSSYTTLSTLLRRIGHRPLF